MTDIPPPEQPGWYADAHGAWWWWDGRTWFPAPSAAGPVAAPASPGDKERSQAVLMWILYLVIGGWISSLVFYLTAKEKRFLRHHAAESLNLALLTLIPQVLSIVLIVPGLLDYFDALVEDTGGTTPTFSASGLFLLGILLSTLASIANLGLGVMGAIKANRGEWWRMPIGLHPVRGVVRPGEEPYSVSDR